MADLGHQLTDKKLDNLEKKIAKEYKTAVKEMEQKYKDYAKQTEKARKVQEKLYQAGEISFDDYVNWQVTHELTGSRWEQMKDVLAADMVHANDIAKGIIKGEMPDIFALNCNYETYSIEHGAGIDTSFVLYNHDTAMYLLGDQRQLMPKPSPKKAAEIAANKDMQWNKQKIQSAVLQGVLQGESPYEVAERLQQVGQMNYNSAVRYARTMGTSAQNAGRYEAFHRAKNLGVDLTIEWSATLDHRTRHSHRNMHGQRHEVDEPFIIIDGGKQYTIYYPADCTGASNAPQKEIWNCRCTLLSWVKGYEGDTVKESPALKDMSFEEWQGKKAQQQEQKPQEPTMTQEERNKILNESFVMKQLSKSGIQRLEVSKLDKPLTEEEIIQKLCGGDETAGSCASLSLAYAANRHGFDVTDFRGGKSQDYISWLTNSIIGKKGIVDTGYKEIQVATSMLDKIEDGKEYILSAGKHAAIVRNVGGVKEYLELQDQTGAWYPLHEKALLNRFGCRKSYSKDSFTGEKRMFDCYLTDIEKLKGDPVFEEVLPYINTQASKQKKGIYGYAK